MSPVPPPTKTGVTKPRIDRRRWIEDVAVRFMAAMLRNPSFDLSDDETLAISAFEAARAFDRVAQQQQYEPMEPPTPTPVPTGWRT